MNFKTLLVAFLFTIGAISDAAAHMIEERQCQMSESKNSGLPAVDKAIKNYNADHFQLCEYEDRFLYEVYSLPRITSEGICLIDVFPFTQSKKPIKTPSAEIYKLWSMSDAGKCQKDSSNYAFVRGITNAEFVKISDSLKKRQNSREPFSLILLKRGRDYHAADFDLFNKLFIEKKLILTSITGQYEGGEIVLQFRRPHKDSTDFCLTIKFNFLDGLFLRYFNSFGVQ